MVNETSESPKDYPYPKQTKWEVVIEVTMELAGLLLLLSLALALIAVTVFLAIASIYLLDKIPR